MARHARAVATDDFLIVLDRRSGKYLSFNATGARVWQLLAAGASAEEIAGDFSRRFGLDPERAVSDVQTVLDGLRRSGLLEAADQAPPRAQPQPPSAALAESFARDLFAVPEDRRPRAGALDFLRALAVLVAVDVCMRWRGLELLYRLIARRDADPATPPSPRRVWALVDAADRAAAFYFKQAWCLQRSAACALVLRRRGVPARLVIGVHPTPFLAHAWVELDGRPVNEKDPALQRMMTVIDRC